MLAYYMIILLSTKDNVFSSNNIDDTEMFRQVRRLYCNRLFRMINKYSKYVLIELPSNLFATCILHIFRLFINRLHFLRFMLNTILYIAMDCVSVAVVVSLNCL